MRKSQPWHHTRFGAIVLWLGGIELAVPVLGFTAAALAVGTYLDSTAGAKVARSVVYSSWWFKWLMAMVCVSLVFAVISRYPWKRRHVGFITVHAGLIILIAGGFWSYVGRVEGQLALQEGTAGDAIETQGEQLEVVEHQAGQFATLGEAPDPQEHTTLSLGGVRVQVLEHWENSREVEQVADDSPGPFRAVRISAGQDSDPIWVGEEERGGGAPLIAGLRVRVLPDGATWEAPPATAVPADYEFIVGDTRYPVGEAGQAAVPGWTVATIKRYSRAMVAGEGLTEIQSGPENPAVEVSITNEAGAVERHTAFLNFPDMIMNRPAEGSAPSGARLVPAAGALGETLVVYGPNSLPQIAYIGPAGDSKVFEPKAEFPRTLDVGPRRITILQQFGRARGGWQTLKAPPAKENRPALVIRIGDATELTVVAWKSMAPIGGQDRNLMVRYGPRLVPLPFAVRLTDFRKADYPGTEMAMSYESDVEVTLPGPTGSAPVPYHIFMNHPYTNGPWKVYQSGFVGENLSIFSVMRDPGLPLTYAGAIVLCVGITITFFSRSLSWGHPGIPIAFVQKESSHAPPVPTSARLGAPARGEPLGACSV